MLRHVVEIRDSEERGGRDSVVLAYLRCLYVWGSSSQSSWDSNSAFAAAKNPLNNRDSGTRE